DWAFITAQSDVLRPGGISPTRAQNRRPRLYRGSAPPRARREWPRARRPGPGPVLLCQCRYPSARQPCRSHAIRTGRCDRPDPAYAAGSRKPKIWRHRPGRGSLARGGLPHTQDLNKAIGGAFAIGARDVEMGDRAHGARAKLWSSAQRPAVARIPDWRMAPPNMRRARTARAMSSRRPATRLPTGQPSPFDNATETTSKGAASSARLRPEAAAALKSRAPSR